MLIERNLIDVCALISTIEGNEAAACATGGEATSTSLELKKKNEECKIKNPQINNECMEKILLQLVGEVMEVENLLKCIIVVLIFLWSCYSSKDLVMSFVSNVVEKVKKCNMLDQIKLQI